MQTSIFDTMGDLFDQAPIKNRINEPRQEKTRTMKISYTGSYLTATNKRAIRTIIENGSFFEKRVRVGRIEYKITPHHGDNFEVLIFKMHRKDIGTGYYECKARSNITIKAS